MDRRCDCGTGIIASFCERFLLFTNLSGVRDLALVYNDVMKVSNLINCSLLATLTLLCCIEASASTVYRTVDDKGTVSFSDTPPDEDVPVETLQIQAPPPQDSEEARQRLEDMRETTDRMVADRQAREKHRAEIRQIQARTSALQSPGQSDPSTDYVSTSSEYWGSHRYPARRPWRPIYRPHPKHPIARPPATRPRPHNDYPASLIRRHYNPRVRAAFR